MECLSHLYPQDLGIYVEEETEVMNNKETTFPRHDRAGTYELTAGTDLLKLKSDETPVQRRGSGQKAPPSPRSYSQITAAARERKLSFLQRSNTGYLNHTPGQDPRSGAVGKNKSNLVFFSGFFVFVFFRERTNMKFHG